MSGLFDKLESEIANRSKEGGISPLDLAELPAELRKLMKHMLREIELTSDKLWEYVENLKDEDKFSKEQLYEALETLSKQGWLIKRGEEGNHSFRVNLRRKASSNLAGSIWGALDDKMATAKKSDSDSGESS